MMFLAREPSEKMSGFPTVNKDFRIFCFVAHRARQTAMVFVRVRQDDAPDVAEFDAAAPQFFTQRFGGLPGFRSDVDERQRLFPDEININVADIKRRRN